MIDNSIIATSSPLAAEPEYPPELAKEAGANDIPDNSGSPRALSSTEKKDANSVALFMLAIAVEYAATRS
jgi:hypothetical protein